MKRSLAGVLVATLALGGILSPQRTLADPAGPDDVDAVASWILDQQFDRAGMAGAGALRWHHTVAHRGGGLEYYRVIPYYSNIALAALLKADVAEAVPAAEAWITWYLDNLNADGTIYDYWYTSDGGNETTCPAGISAGYCTIADSEDSYAATFLGLVDLWTRADPGGAQDLLVANATAKGRLVKVALVLTGLQQADGLTWARDNWRFKYLEDNAETYWGFKANARIQRDLYDDTTAAQDNETRGNRTGNGIFQKLFDHDRCYYHWAVAENDVPSLVNPSLWDPHSFATMFPALYGVTPGTGSIDRTMLTSINRYFPSWTNQYIADLNGWLRLWPQVAHAFQLAGDTTTSQRADDFIRDEKYPGGYTGSAFEWVWTIADGGWHVLDLAGAGSFALALPNHSIPDSCSNPTPPGLPTIGCTQTPGAPKQVECTFRAVDADGHRLRHTVNWGDGVVELSPFVDSGANHTRQHAYATNGRFTVTDQATDAANPPWSSGVKGFGPLDVQPPALNLLEPRSGFAYQGCTNPTPLPSLPAPLFVRRGCLKVSYSDQDSSLLPLSFQLPGSCGPNDFALPPEPSGTTVIEYDVCTIQDSILRITVSDARGNSAVRSVLVKNLPDDCVLAPSLPGCG